MEVHSQGLQRHMNINDFTLRSFTKPWGIKRTLSDLDLVSTNSRGGWWDKEPLWYMSPWKQCYCSGWFVHFAWVSILTKRKLWGAALTQDSLQNAFRHHEDPLKNITKHCLPCKPACITLEVPMKNIQNCTGCWFPKAMRAKMVVLISCPSTINTKPSGHNIQGIWKILN